MEFGSLLPRVALALGIGLLIGLERGWRTRAADVASDTVSKVAIGAIIGRGRFAAEIGMMAILCLLVAGVILGATFVLLPGRAG
jgi:uncharacterized membrane protein YhiD involved in acid resistance